MRFWTFTRKVRKTRIRITKSRNKNTNRNRTNSGVKCNKNWIFRGFKTYLRKTANLWNSNSMKEGIVLTMGTAALKICWITTVFTIFRRLRNRVYSSRFRIIWINRNKGDLHLITIMYSIIVIPLLTIIVR